LSDQPASDDATAVSRDNEVSYADFFVFKANIKPILWVFHFCLVVTGISQTSPYDFVCIFRKRI